MKPSLKKNAFDRAKILGNIMFVLGRKSQQDFG